MRSATLTLLLALVPAGVALTQRARPPAGGTEPQSPFGDSQGATDVFGRDPLGKRAAKIDQLVLGAWRLTALHEAPNDLQPTSIVGYALFVDGYMSIELHTALRDSLDLDEDYMMSGTYRYAWDDGARLRLSALIGSTTFTEFNELEFIPPGTSREYSVEVDQTGLELTRLDTNNGSAGPRFLFQRMENSSPTAKVKRDFYGRLIPVEETEDAVEGPPVRVPLPPRQR